MDPTAVQPVEPALLDAVALRALMALFEGDPEGWHALIRTQLDQMAGLKQAVAAATVRGDFAVWRRAAHTLRSSAGLFGASDFVACCTALERAADDGSVCDEVLDRWMKALDGLAFALAAQTGSSIAVASQPPDDGRDR